MSERAAVSNVPYMWNGFVLCKKIRCLSVFHQKAGKCAIMIKMALKRHTENTGFGKNRMFGYIQIEKDSLLLREIKAYRGFYCGLCHVLKSEYGGLARALLSYDCAFAALLLAVANGAGYERLKRGSCSVNPIGRKEPLIKDCDELRFAAALNVILAYYSLEDKWTDNKNILARSAMLIYGRAHKKAAAKYPEVEKGVKTALVKLHEQEEKGGDTDAAANASAEILSSAVDAYPIEDETDKRIMHELTKHMGRWIYILDAWNDREKDKKHSSYNPINLSGLSKERVTHLLYGALSEAKTMYDMLNKKGSRFANIVDNVLADGCAIVTEQVLQDAYNKRRNKKHMRDII